MKHPRSTLAATLAALFFAGWMAHASADAEKDSASAAATFAVHCYDVGKAALRALDGVMEVTSGWRGREEVNRVRFVPTQITVAQMEAALRKAGTFIRTIRPKT